MATQETGEGACANGARLARVGRDGALRLRFARRGSATVLTERLGTLPLQCLEPITMPCGSLCVVPLNPTGGLVGGDRLRTEIDLGPGARVCLTTPSATKVYRASGAPTLQDTVVQVADAALLEYVPDHVIPHAGAWLEQALRVELAGSGQVLLWDAFAAGRLACGERWTFERLTSRIDVRHDGRLVFLDRFDVRGSERMLAGLGGLDGLGYSATLVALDANYERWEELADELHLAGASLGPGVAASASALARFGLCARIVSATAYELGAALRASWALLRRRWLKLPAADLRKS